MSDRKPQFAVAIPQISSEPRVNVGTLKAFLANAEAAGYHSFWVQDQLLIRGEGGLSSLEPLTLLTYAASVTQRAKLGTSVLLTLLRNPVHLAKIVATLDQLSEGRLILGVGLGASTAIYPAFGFGPERRVRRFVEGLEVMKRLWTEDHVNFNGEFQKIENGSIRPRPVQRPHPPIWFGANDPRALARAVRLGDGWMGAGSASTESFRERVAQVRRPLKEAGRNPATFTISKRVYLAIDPDRSRALQRMRDWSGRYYGNPEMADRFALVGSVEEVVKGLRDVHEAGADLILLNPLFDELGQLDLLTERVVPALA